MDQLLAMRAFSRVVEAGNFTKAAGSLEMPKATVSKLVQQLEAHLRTQLLQRSTRRVAVTADGQAYYEKSQRLLRELEDIDGSFSVARQRPRGRLRVDVGSSVASQLLVPQLPDFIARFPDVSLALGVSDNTVDLIGDSVDCVIRGGFREDSGLVSRTIGRASMVTCATPAYLKRFGTPDRPRDLQKAHRLVSYVSARSGRVLPMRFMAQGRIIEPELSYVLGVNESNAHFAAGLAGIGIIQTFRFLAQGALERGELVPLLSRHQPEPYGLHVAYPSNRHVTTRLRAFIDWAAEVFARVE
jgi:LysR family transcriptional regulator, regulator for bpeEF and oprC